MEESTLLTTIGLQKNGYKNTKKTVSKIIYKKKQTREKITKIARVQKKQYDFYLYICIYFN